LSVVPGFGSAACNTWPMAKVGVLTDSTACLPADTPTGRPEIVPLTVVTPDGPRLEGAGAPIGGAEPDSDEEPSTAITPVQVAELLHKGDRLTTSQPSPTMFRLAFGELLESGADDIVAVLLSGELSGTCHTATMTAEATEAPVVVVDSRTATMALGYAALAAQESADSGADAAQVAARARAVAASAQVRLIVDALDDLRRGGRLSTARAGFGAALGVRPILAVVDGRLQVVQRLRTRAAARERLVDLAVTDLLAMSRPVAAVHYVGEPERADELAAEIFERCAVRPVVTPLSAVLAAHTGPDTIAVAVADFAAAAD